MTTNTTPETPFSIEPPSTLVWENRQQFKQRVLDHLAEGARHIQIDFGKTGYVDASGLGVLVSLSKRIRGVGGTLTLANLNEDLQALFKLTQLDQLFRVVSSPRSSSET